MKTNRILIFAPYQLNKNMGGPSGFLAHNLLSKPRDIFCFIEDLFPLKFRNRYSVDRIFQKLMYLNRLSKVEKIFNSIDASSYKYIFFHDCLTLYKCMRLINKNQVVILQSHSPELPSEEYLSENFDLEMYSYVRKAEQESFKRADLLIFPNKGAAEIYNDLITDKLKIQYILSGASREEKLTKYPLDSRKLNILFIGRRNTIKGFDFLMDVFSNKKLQNNHNLLLLGTKTKETQYPNNIYDIGFSNSPLNWVNSVDYVINTNKQSYFDLSVIEALSIGAKIIMTDNYGHSYFKNKSNDIITFEYGNISNVVDIISSLDKSQTYQKSTENLELYENELSDNCYLSRLEIFYKNIK